MVIVSPIMTAYAMESINVHWVSSFSIAASKVGNSAEVSRVLKSKKGWKKMKSGYKIEDLISTILDKW